MFGKKPPDLDSYEIAKFNQYRAWKSENGEQIEQPGKLSSQTHERNGGSGQATLPPTGENERQAGKDLFLFPEEIPKGGGSQVQETEYWTC